MFNKRACLVDVIHLCFDEMHFAQRNRDRIMRDSRQCRQSSKSNILKWEKRVCNCRVVGIVGEKSDATRVFVHLPNCTQRITIVRM